MNKKPIKILRNCQITSITAGVPSGHQHIRTAIETQDEIIVLQEASIASLVRAYTTIKTHPIIKGVHLEGIEPAERKTGYAPYQLLESNLKDSESISLLDDILKSEE